MNKENLRDANSDRAQAAIGLAILRCLVPAPDHGAGFRRDPETGFVYYSSEWLSDERKIPETGQWVCPGSTFVRAGDGNCICGHPLKAHVWETLPNACGFRRVGDAKAPE